ncbi:hypothetical protein C2845_PM18G05980 [Panicum miliaceum]|uniref:Uncharacterized protein n=1 Tax=Panicum miliaceum TaxID=4540 RepID=A0A3L6PHG5_PANMI|nr:hypothetical protein C2845_PM18G05980 [Panicum miliaceum]
MVASALAQEVVSRESSYISTKLDDRASREHIATRLRMALSRLEFVPDRTRKWPITYVSLIRHWNMFRCATDLQVQGHGQTRQVVVRSSTFLQQIASSAQFSISSLRATPAIPS